MGLNLATPKPFPKAATACAVAGVIVLCSLGHWQQERLAWKNALQAELDAELGKDARRVSLEAGDLASLKDQQLRRGTLTGHFDFDHQIVLRGQIANKKSVNYVLIPFILEDNRPVVVVAGYQDGAEPLPHPATAGREDSITGTARVPQWSRFTPENMPEKGQWYRADLSQMAAHLGLPAPYPVLFYLEESSVIPATLPRVETTRTLRNDHQQYAIFWYTMALILTAIYVLRFWRKTTAAV